MSRLRFSIVALFQCSLGRNHLVDTCVACEGDATHAVELLQTGLDFHSPRGTLATGVAAVTSSSKVTIAMGDNRPVFPQGIPTNVANATPIALAAALNLQYAKRHGYNFEFLQYIGNATLDQNGSKVPRHPAWSKLLAVQHASQGQSDASVVWMDSDAIFIDQNTSVERYLQEHEVYLPGINPLARSTGGPVPPSKESCSVYMFKDKDKPEYPLDDWYCSGVMFWTQPFNRGLLSEWWSTDVRAAKGQFEQDALNFVVVQNHPREVCAVQDSTPWGPQGGFGTNYYIRHNSDQFAEFTNLPEFTSDHYFPEAFQNLSYSNFDDIMRELKDHVVEMPQDALDALAASL